MIFNCKCGKEIVVSRDQVAVSSDPLFQAIGMLGSAKGMIQPADHIVLEKVTLQNPDGTTTVSHKGHLTITVSDPETGETRQIPVEVGGKQELLLTPGIHRDFSLPRPADKVFVLALKVMEPSDVGDSVQPWLHRIRNDTGRYSSIRIGATTSASATLPDGKVNVLCHLFAVSDLSMYAPWFEQMLQAIEDTTNENSRAAVLDYSRACEMFISDYLQQTMKLVKNLDGDFIGQIMKLARSVEAQVTRLLPSFSTDAAGYRDAQQSWAQNVQAVRNQRVAHVPLGISDEQCRQAYESAYWFIRAIQNQCPFDEGKTWDYWTKLTKINVGSVGDPSDND
jgi:hypothetical protein